MNGWRLSERGRRSLTKPTVRASGDALVESFFQPTDDFQHFDRRLVVAVDRADAPVGHMRKDRPRRREQWGVGGEFQVPARLDFSQHLVSDQDRAQRRLALQDLITHLARHEAEIQAHNAYFNDDIRALRPKDDLARVKVVFQVLLDDIELHGPAILRFEHLGHVIFVHEQPVKRLGDLLGWNLGAGGADIGAFSDEGEAKFDQGLLRGRAFLKGFGSCGRHKRSGSATEDTKDTERFLSLPLCSQCPLWRSYCLDWFHVYRMF